MKKYFAASQRPAKIFMFFFSFIVMFLILTLITSCSGSRIYTLENKGETIELAQGDSITLKLESNPTTGYGWQLTDDMDGTVIILTSTEFKQSKKDEGLVGSGGYEYFYIKSIAPGSTDIILNYARPWEEGIEPVDVFKLSVIVK
jgi:inhibitor of cysteine peptidase